MMRLHREPWRKYACFVEILWFGALILIELLNPGPAHAQDLLWAKRAGGTAIDLANAVAVDSSINSYVTGRFGTTATFGPGEANQTMLTSASQDVFVAKYDLTGKLQWARQANGAVAVGTGIAVDSLKNSYVTGSFSNTITFAPGTLNPVALASAGSDDLFVAKYDVDGSLLWARRDGGTSGEVAQGIGLDSDANSYVAGRFSGTATFGLGEAHQTVIVATGSPCGDPNLFIAKYNSSGAFQWVKRASNTAATSIATDSLGNSWVVGEFCGSATFAPGEAGETILTAAVATRDIFVARYNSAGALQWAKRVDTTLGSTLEAHVATDGFGNSYVTGLFRGSATFAPGEGPQTTLTSAGNEDIFLAKYDSSGTLQWARRAGGTGIDFGTGIAVDALGESYITGYFRDAPATFGAGEANETTLTSVGNEDVFIAKYDIHGLLQWARRAGGGSDDRGLGIALDIATNPYVVGRFSGLATFGLGESNQTSLQSANNFDIFVAKYLSGPILIACPTDPLQDAVNFAPPGATVLVSGTCNGNVIVRNEKQRVTIDGSREGVGTRATVNGLSSSPSFNVRGKGIAIQNFTVLGGSVGIYVNRGSNAVLNNNIVQNSSTDGVVVDELALAVMTNNTIQNNPGVGIAVSEASTARIGFNADSDTVASPNTIQNNALGIVVSNNSSARIIGNTIQNNSGAGIQILRDSQADIASNSIDSNGGDGVDVGEDSLIELGEDSGASIYESPNSGTNTAFGIKCMDAGIAEGRQGSLTGNGGSTDFAPNCISRLTP